MSYATEFGPEYAPPPVIAAIVASGELLDVSWHNDVAPSFTHRDGPPETRLWVHPENPAEREDPGSRGCSAADLDDLVRGTFGN